MKNSTFWKLGLTAALLFSLSACSDTSSSGDEYDDESSQKTSSSSSSSKDNKDGKSSGKETSSSSVATAKDSVYCDSIEIITLAVPSDLNVVKNSDTSWILLWNYSANDSRPENGFLIEYLNMKDTIPSWKQMDSTEAAVTMYNLVGTEKADKYYRVSAKDKCLDKTTKKFVSKYSKPSSMVQATTTGSGSTSISEDLSTPTSLELDSIGRNKWRLSWSYTDNSNRPENGFQIQKLDLTDGLGWTNLPKGTTTKGVHHFIIDNTDTSFNNIYLRVGAKDASGSIGTYSEEILVPTFVDYTNPNEQKKNAAPTDVKLDTLGFGQYQLSWEYDDNADNGFILQSLNPTEKGSDWVIDKNKVIKKGVHLVILDGMGADGGLLFRVAALIGSAKSDTSLYSTAIAIPSVSTDGTVDNGTITSALSIPSNLEVIDIGGNKYRITWNYQNNSSRAAEGFDIEKLDANAEKPEWTEQGSTNKDVYFYTVEATDKEMTYRVSAKDNKGNSEWSESVEVPKAYEKAPKKGCVGTFSVPTNFKAEKTAPNAWRLIWDYSKNEKCVEEGFVVQKLNISADGTKEWIDNDTTAENVHYYNIEGISNLRKYYRVAAYRGSDTTTFTKDIQITRLIDYSEEGPFKTPVARARIYYHFEDHFKASLFDDDGNLKDGVKSWYNGYPHYFNYEMVIDEGFPNHAMVYYKNTVSLVYQIRWNNETYDQWDTIAITDTTRKTSNEYQTLIPRELDDNKYDDDNRKASRLCHHYAQARIIWTVKDEEGEVKDTTDWSDPVGPVYNTFEYLETPGQSTDCEALFTEDQKSDGTYKNTAKYKACDYYQPLGYRPCAAS